MEDELRFAEYFNYVNNCIKQVQCEMALGNIDSQQVLLQVAKRDCEILNSLQAYELINNHSPYEWENLVNRDLCKALKYNLANIICSVANQTVVEDVLSKLMETEGYRFLIGKALFTSMMLPDGRKVIFQEKWRSNVEGSDYLAPLEITSHENKELSIYQEGGDNPLIYVLEHSDPALAWVTS